MIQKYVLYVLYIGEFWQTPYCHLKGQNCPLCSHRAYKYTTEEFIKRAKEVHGDKYDYSKVEYIDNKTKICIICPKHGEFLQTPNDHLNGYGCKICKESHLERKVRTLLQNNGFIFESQKTFNWLKNKSNMYLDFYLPEYNVAIECQGEQHFKPIEYFGGEEKYNKQIINDDLKKKLCEENNIKLIYFSYNNKDNDLLKLI